MPRMARIVQMMLVQAGTMFLLNQIAASFPASRRILKGGILGGGNSA